MSGSSPRVQFSISALVVLGLGIAVGCRTSSNETSVKIVNGRQLSEAEKKLARSVFKIQVLGASEETSATLEKECTGVAISSKVLLVAAHCVPAGSQAERRLKIEGKKAEVSRIIGPESLRGVSLLSARDAASDLAALELSGNQPIFSGDEIAVLAPAPAHAGTQVRIMGYGATSLEPARASESSVLSVGSQVIATASADTFEFRAKATELASEASDISLAAPGDSGAPVFDRENRLIGIVVGLSYHQGQEPIKLHGNPDIVAREMQKADAYGNKVINLQSALASKIIKMSLGQETLSPLSHRKDVESSYLAICRSRKGERLRDLKDSERISDSGEIKEASESRTSKKEPRSRRWREWVKDFLEDRKGSSESEPGKNISSAEIDDVFESL